MAGPYNFRAVLVYDRTPGGTLRLLRNGQVTARDATGIAPDDAGTGPVLTTLTSDADGTVTYTHPSIPTVDLVSPLGFVSRETSPDAFAEASSAAAAAASSASSAQDAANSAASSAALVGAPAGNAIDAHIGPTLVSGGGDQTSALNSFLASTTPLGVKRLIGAFSVTAVVNIAASMYLDMSAATITTTVATGNAVTVTAANVTIRGGEIVSPATFDGANVQPTYAVVHATASGFKALGMTLTNVPKVGFYMDDADDLTVSDCTIVGNYPAGSYTGVETGHFGIAVNPGTSGRSGRSLISGNLIRSCVQGVFFGNYGATATGALGGTVTGNVFDGCHNHGVYNAGGVDGCTITGNSFSRCALPVALTGTGHTVSGNSMVTMGTGNNLDLVGISIREAVDCSVTGNTIKGDAPTASVIIDIANFTGSSLRGNVVADNVIDVSGGTATGIRVGRTPQTTSCSDNIVANNTIRSVGNAGVGLITVQGGAGFGNKVTGNMLVVKGESHGIYVATVSHTTVQNNSIRYEYDAPSAKTLGAVVLNGTTYCTVSLNDIHNPATFGTNVALRGVWEQGASSKNRIIQNGYHGDLTKLTSLTPIVLITNSDAYLDERGIGSPSGAFYGAPGSRWSREDGGAGTAMYVKETANTSATWARVVGTTP